MAAFLGGVIVGLVLGGGAVYIFKSLGTKAAEAVDNIKVK